MMPDERKIDPRLAADLGKAPDEKLATDLSRSAIAARGRQQRLRAAAGWAKAMKRAFKGISGSHTRRGYVHASIRRDPVLRKEIESDVG